MPAPRARHRRDFPRGLYETRPGYFVYRVKGQPQRTLGAVPREFAIAEAHAANAALTALRPRLADLVTGRAGHTVGDLLARMPASRTPNTAKSRRYQDRVITDALGAGTDVAGITVAACAEVLEKIAADGNARKAQAIRSRMVQVFKRAQALGWRETNPAEPTSVAAPEVLRDRLTLPLFLQILAHARGWLPSAMLLLLITGQDRDTVVRMRREDVRGDYLIVQRRKTERTNQPVGIHLGVGLQAVGVTLRTLLARCGADYLVCESDGGPVAVDRVSKRFTEARRAAGIPDVMPSGKLAPTYYEIKSLGKRLYNREGKVDTRALFSHRDEKTHMLYGDPRGAEPILVDIKKNS